MLDQDEMRRINLGFKVIRLIWISMLVALAAHIVIANVISEGATITGGEPDEVFDLVKYTLYAFGALELAMAYVIRRAIRNPRGWISRLLLFSTLLSLPVLLIWIEKSLRSPVLHYISSILTCTGMCLAVGIYGLIIFIIEADYLSLYFLVAVSALAMIYFRPRKQELIDIALQMKEDSATRSGLLA